MDEFSLRVKSLLDDFQRASQGFDYPTVIAASLSLAAHLLSEGRPPMPSHVLFLLELIAETNDKLAAVSVQRSTGINES